MGFEGNLHHCLLKMRFSSAISVDPITCPPEKNESSFTTDIVKVVSLPKNHIFNDFYDDIFDILVVILYDIFVVIFK